MHIPDGYLGPLTCGIGYAAMVPVWTFASRQVRKTLSVKQVPLLAIGAAFSFVIMMFNVPIPGGTTGHAVGGALAAILLGPWAACIAVSVALVIQALLFGDGGITAIGANCFNMAFVLPFAGYLVYKLISGKAALTSFRRVVAAGIAGYAGLVIASLCAGVEFGLQPILHHTASGQALYCPYGFKVAIASMVGGHALVFGWVELVATALVVKFLQVQEPSLLERAGDVARHMKTSTKLWIGLGILAILSPIGLYLPYAFNAGPAWGEWGPEEMRGLVGFVPKGLHKLTALWNAPLKDYAFKGWDSLGFKHLSVAYIVSAVLGIGLCVGLAFLLGRLLSKKETGIDGKERTRRAGGFIERTIEATVSLLKETVSLETVASRDGFLQRCDPRFKCLSAVALLIAVLMAKSVVELSVLYMSVLFFVVVSSIGLWFFLERTLLFVPIFSLFIALPAIFNTVTPGEPLVSFTVFSWTLSITRPGVDSAVIFFMRVLDSVSVAVLLVITTKQHVLLKVLRVFRVPQLFVMTMGMTYRYIFLFLDIIQKMFISIKSRVGFISSSKTGRHVVTANIAGLWLRSYRLQSQVYDAMTSRGYAGEAYVLDEFNAKPVDFFVTLLALCALIGTIWVNRFFL
jgi:cobalt/nickel transport system permease protein